MCVWEDEAFCLAWCGRNVYCQLGYFGMLNSLSDSNSVLKHETRNRYHTASHERENAPKYIPLTGNMWYVIW